MNGNEIPQQWVKTTLGHIVDYGRSAKKTLVDVNDNTWVLELEDIEKDSSKLLSKVKASDRKFKSTKNTFHQGDVLYGKLRPYLNKVIMADEDGVCTTEIIPINAEPFCINRYIFFWLKNPIFLRYVREVSYGVNMPRLGTNDGKSAPFYLAPLAEQKIIADKLDDLLARVESIKIRLENIPEILKKFRQSVLNSVVKGTLPSSFHKSDHKNQKTFKEIGITIKTGPFGSALHKDDYVLDGVPVINPMHIKDGVIYPSDSMTISNEKFLELSSWALEHNDIIVGRRGEMGRAAIIHDSSKKMLCGTGSLILRGNEKILPKYLEFIIRSPDAIDYFSRESVGTTMINLNQKIINGLSVNLPSIEKQLEIVDYIEKFHHYSATIEKMIGNALLRINNLTQSILAKAFHGELTAQWREENPELISGLNSAEALLEKITAEKLAAGTIKKRAKKTSH
ncbi:TPA: restriction endonuclease subunit S [Klebsiella pneumoniae]